MAKVAQKNRAVTLRAEKALERYIGKIENEFLPVAMNRIGDVAVSHSRRTKTYQNKTGALEASHAFEVVKPGQSTTIVFDAGTHNETENFTSPKNEIHLLLYAGKQYGFYVERLYGFDVLIQTFLFFRREFTKILGDLIKSRRVG